MLNNIVFARAKIPLGNRPNTADVALGSRLFVHKSLIMVTDLNTPHFHEALLRRCASDPNELTENDRDLLHAKQWGDSNAFMTFLMKPLPSAPGALANDIAGTLLVGSDQEIIGNSLAHRWLDGEIGDSLARQWLDGESFCPTNMPLISDSLAYPQIPVVTTCCSARRCITSCTHYDV